MKQFAKKSFRHVIFNNFRNSPWTVPIACANFSLEKFFNEIGINPVVIANKEEYDCLVI